MVHTFTFPQEMIDSIQERVEVLERCLNDANPQDEAMAEIRELANSRQISLSQLREEVIQLQDKLNKVIKLVNALKEKVKQDKSLILLLVKYYFLLKEILDKYVDFLLIKDGIERLSDLIVDSLNLTEIIYFHDTISYSGIYPDDEQYIMVETIKHFRQSLISASLRIKALYEVNINIFDLGDNTPQESEAMLISLASTKKWDQVYRNLA